MKEGFLRVFEMFGSDVRLVGGCVRDSLLGVEFEDYDFACVLTPQEVERVVCEFGYKAVLVGKEFGTVVAVIEGESFEITSLRMDVKTDGRHAKVEFGASFVEDAKRRDFTINALYMDQDSKIYDYVDGYKDLQDRVVRFIGDADLRIREDYLRILRFFRFSLFYAKGINIVGLEACVVNKKGLGQLSRERVRQEFFKIILSHRFEFLIEILNILQEKEILPELFSQRLLINNFEGLLNLSNKNLSNQNLSNQGQLTFGDNLKKAALFLDVNTDLEILFKEICATNIEKKYFKFLCQNRIVKIDDLKILLISNDRDHLFDLLLFEFINQNINQKLLLEGINYLKNVKIPKFPISAKDLITRGFYNKEIGKKLTEIKINWALSDFVLSKAQLLKNI